MQEKDVITIASKYATEKGLEVDLYKASVDGTETAWEVNFVRTNERNKPIPGDFFTVIILKISKSATEIIYGK